ncbi:MAG: hypothetical protein JOZ33_02120 [Acidobacteriaceae bacterium]|nr:hypothetical protein [Acidobacteriaceae bacterium]
MVLRLGLFGFLALVIHLAASCAFADPAPFDLQGPRIDVKVKRGDQTLPITAVPNLAAGDKLFIYPDFPSNQGARYLLVAAFLRGSTNPPPEDWFFKLETWNKKAAEGLHVTVPEGAQQVLLFLAPETGGDFKTLVNAVRGRPGAFVRASQDLNQASLDRTRLDAYLAAVRNTNSTDSSKLKEVTPFLARSLGIKLDKDCLEKDVEEQASCLTQKQDSLILNDGHSMSIVGALTSGPASDLGMQAALTAQASFGYYSPYVASIMDIARILDSFHTAEYQYIPALGIHHENGLDLKLNTPPSFHNPKSVLVIALPAVETSQPPPLHPVDEKQVFCATKEPLVLPADGAPLVFSTAYARNMVLRIKQGDRQVDLPLKADPAEGGLVADNKAVAQTGQSGGTLHGTLTGTIHGFWGFTPFEGPTFHLQGPRELKWKIAATDQDALVVGREDTLHLSGDNASCVESVQFRNSLQKDVKAQWKLSSPDSLQVTLPLKDEQPGPLTLSIKQYGLQKPDEVSLRSYSAAGSLDGFSMHAGDDQGTLTGARLDEVAIIEVHGIRFQPGQLSRKDGKDELVLSTKDAEAAGKLAQGDQVTVAVTLRDGRTETIQTTVQAMRPKVNLLNKSIETVGVASNPTNIQIAGQHELPQNSQLVFSIKAQIPPAFSREDKVEIATEDGLYSTLLSIPDGTLTLQDPKTALATLNPAKAFGSSAFGPLHFRIVDGTGSKGDWQPLATLVRLPNLQDLKCPPAEDQPCSLTGSGLFLLDSVSSDAAFTHPVQVPDGFPGSELSVPHPEGASLYIKLRDDPTVVDVVTLPLEPLLPSKAQSASARQSRHPSSSGAAGSAQHAPATSSEPAASPAPAPSAQEPASAASSQVSSTAPTP